MTRRPARLPATQRILIGAHSHPALSKGGAEIAAWRHHQAMQAHGWHSSFIGCTREPTTRDGVAITQPFGPGQYLYTSTGFDWFKFANPDQAYPGELKSLLAELRPDIVHLHHYAVFGVETFLHIRTALPDAKIVLTLHEFQAICNHYGQMITRPQRTLCDGASPRACNRCFPEFSRADFFLRDTYLRRFLDLVDHFIAPSQFLATRYIAWGLDPARVSVVENITTPPTLPPAPAPASDRLRIGFFGQISPLKGIQILLEAAARLEADDNTHIQFDVHGDHSHQPEEFQAEFASLRAAAGRNVRFHGPYDNGNVDRLMHGVDAVLVPSIWWENAPVVIQEARRNHRPVICSDIGGMAEKVRPGIDGLHFPMGNAAALADLLAAIAADRTLLPTPAGAPDHAGVIGAHLALYARITK